MNEKKKTLALLFVLAVCLGVILVPRGYPDWALNVMQREGTTFVVTGSVDANITNTEINAYVTNSTITITPEAGTVFEIKPATGVVFNIQGQVDANITNTQLNAYVTNSTITIEPEAGTVFEIKPATGVTFNITGDVNATIQGTASVSIDYATITVDVATIREKASAENKLEFEGGGTNVDAGSSKIETVYTNTLGETLYLEMITFAVYKTSSSAPDVSPLSVHLYFRIRDESNAIVAGFDANPCSSPLNFDPAIPILPNWKIEVVVENYSDTRIGAEWSILLRKG